MRQKMEPIIDRRLKVATGGGFNNDIQSEGQKLRKENSGNYLVQNESKDREDKNISAFDSNDPQTLTGHV